MVAPHRNLPETDGAQERKTKVMVTDPFAPYQPPKHIRHLTVSALGTFKECPRKYLFEYIHGVRSEHWSSALNIGRAVHAALPFVLSPVGELGDALEAVGDEMVSCVLDAGEVDDLVVAFDAAMARGLVRFWYFEQPEPLRMIHHEVLVWARIRAGESKRAMPGWRKAGKADAIAMCKGKRLGELKTTSEHPLDVVAGMLRGLQVPNYVGCYEEMTGEELDGAFIEVIRRPRIKPRKNDAPEDYENRIVAYCKEKQALSAEDPKYLFYTRQLIDRPMLTAGVANTSEEFREVAQAINRYRRAEWWPGREGPPPMSPCQYCRVKAACWQFEDQSHLKRAPILHPELGLEQ